MQHCVFTLDFEQARSILEGHIVPFLKDVI